MARRKTMTFTIHPRLERRLAEVANRKCVTKSSIVNEALAWLLEPDVERRQDEKAEPASQR